MNRKTRHTLILTVLLLLPAKNYFVYYGLVFLVLLLLFFAMRYPKIRISSQLHYAIVLFGVALVDQILRSIFLSPTGGSIRDLFEFARFVPVIVVLLCDGIWDQIEYSALFRAACIFLLLDLAVSLVQLLGAPSFGIVNVVKMFFNEPAHFESSLQIAGRTLGFSPGPGQHGLMAQMVFYILFAGFISGKSGMKGAWTILATLLSVLNLLLTQSQSSFIASILGVCALSIYLAIFGLRFQKRRIWLLGLIAVVVAVPLVVMFWSNLRYLSTVFVQGISRHSYTARQEKWEIVLNMIQNSYLQLIIGFGKQYFGEYGTAMDNEFLFVLVVYGAIFCFLLYMSIIFYLTRSLVEPKRYIENSWRILLLGFLISGLIVSWPASFLLYPPMSVFFAFFLIGSEKDRSVGAQ